MEITKTTEEVVTTAQQEVVIIKLTPAEAKLLEDIANVMEEFDPLDENLEGHGLIRRDHVEFAGKLFRDI